jgi:hypothetical protein
MNTQWQSGDSNRSMRGSPQIPIYSLSQACILLSITEHIALGCQDLLGLLLLCPGPSAFILALSGSTVDLKLGFL